MTDAAAPEVPARPLTAAAAHRIFSALSQPSRLAVFMHVAAAGPGGRPTQALAAALRTTGSALTAHLHALEGAGLVSVRVGPRGARAPVVVADVDRCLALALWLADLGRSPGSSLSEPTRAALETIVLGVPASPTRAALETVIVSPRPPRLRA